MRRTSLLACLAVAATGCGSTVTIFDAGEDGEGPGVDDEPTCIDVEAPKPETVDLRVEGPASLVLGKLHLTGSANDSAGYFVATVDQGALWLPSTIPFDIDTEARWLPFFADVHVQIRRDGNAMLADLLFPAGPATSDIEIGSSLLDEEHQAFTVFEERAYFCRIPTGGTKPELVSVGQTVSTPVPTAQAGCYPGFERVVMGGGLVVSLHAQDGGDILISSLAQEGAIVSSFGFVGSGAHKYGTIQDAATDGARVVVTTDNDGWMLVFDDEGGFGPQGPYVPFTRPGPRRLLTVLDEVAYFASRDAVVAYDLHDVGAPVLMEAQAPTTWDPTTVTFLTATDDTLFVRDAEGQLWSVPRSLAGAASPTAVYLGEPHPLDETCLD